MECIQATRVWLDDYFDVELGQQYTSSLRRSLQFAQHLVVVLQQTTLRSSAPTSPSFQKRYRDPTSDTPIERCLVYRLLPDCFELGASLFDRHKYERALKLLNKFMLGHPVVDAHHDETKDMIAIIHCRADGWSAASTFLKPSLDKFGLLEQLEAEYFAKNDWEKLANFIEARGIVGGYKYYSSLANYFSQHSDYAKAEKYLYQLHGKYDLQAMSAMDNLAKGFFKEGKLISAAEWCLKATRLKRDLFTDSTEMVRE